MTSTSAVTGLTIGPPGMPAVPGIDIRLDAKAIRAPSALLLAREGQRLGLF